MRAIIYCRVSTKNQVENYSIGNQEEDCKKFAEKHGYEVDKVFYGRGESAKTQDRPELQELLKYSLINKGKIQALIVWKLDRLARNLADHYSLIQNFVSLKIKVLSATENNEETSVGKLTRGFAGLVAQYENDIKSDRTKAGMTGAIKQGRWAWRAPIGYKNTRDPSDKSLIVPTQESRFIKEAFELVATGLYKQTQVVENLKRKGFSKITAKLITHILRNPIYAGMIKTKWFPELFEGIHQAIISKELFYKVQDILDGKKPQVAPKSRNHPDFPLRRFVKCPECEKCLTGSWSKGRSKKYAYYHCPRKNSHLNIKKASLDLHFYNYLKSLEPSKKLSRFFEAIVLDIWKTKKEGKKADKINLTRELQELETRKKLIFDKMIEDVIDRDTYKQKTQEIENLIQQKKPDLNEALLEMSDIDKYVKYCNYFVSNIADKWRDAPLADKQRFQQIAFPEGVTYQKDGSFRTARISPIFNLLQESKNNKSNLATPV